MMRRWGLVGALAIAAAVCPCGRAVQVDVVTTAGTFTVELDESARNGAAAFLGLAEGWLDWVDPQSGEPRHETPFYEGTCMGWVAGDDAGEPLLLGNLGRRFTDTSGARNWNNGAGLELHDDVTGATGLVARSVAMVQQNGPHSIDGCWAVLLQDADDQYGGRWSRFGTVVSNWDVVLSIAARTVDASGWLENPAEVTAMRVRGDEAEIAAWRAIAEAPDKFPTVEWSQAHATSNGICWSLPPRSRFRTTTTTALTGTWSTQEWWNEREELDISWNDLGLTGTIGFAHGGFTAVAYPELGGPDISGQFTFRAEWEMGPGEENQVYQYDLDVGAGTGMVRQLDLATQTQVLRSATCNQFITARCGAHSMGISVVIGDWFQIPYYWLGEAKSGAGMGRFKLWDPISGGEVWGNWVQKPN